MAVDDVEEMVDHIMGDDQKPGYETKSIRDDIDEGLQFGEEVEEEEETVEPEEAEEPTNEVEIGGKLYQKDELNRMIEDHNKQPEPVEIEKSDFVKSLSKDITELEKMKGEAEDSPVVQRAVEMVERMAKQMAKMDESVNDVSKETRQRKVNDEIVFMRREAQKILGVDLPEIGTQEFNSIVDSALNGNKVVQGYLAINKNAPKPKPNLKDHRVRTSTERTVDSAHEAEVRDLAVAMGRDPDKVARMIGKVERRRMGNA